MAEIRYPVGKFVQPESVDAQVRQTWIQELASVPQRLHAAVQGLDDGQLDTRYRADSWTLRQVAHHLADASMNGLIRTKLALTETMPTVKPFDEGGWADLADSAQLDVAPSLAIVDGIYARWTALLLSLREEDFARAFNHPVNGPTTLDHATAFFVWHAKHHISQIVALREQEGW